MRSSTVRTAGLFERWTAGKWSSDLGDVLFIGRGERACDSPALYIFSLNSAINSCRRLRAPAVISENWMPIPAGVSFPLPVA
jgi:hypothetical protein